MRQQPTRRIDLSKVRTQRGITVWALLYVLVTLGVIALVAIKSLPVYINAYDVRQTLESVASDPDMRQAGAARIQSAIQRRFDAGYVDNVRGRDVAVKRVDDARELSIAYEVRRPFLLNMSVVYSFEERARVGGADGG